MLKEMVRNYEDKVMASMLEKVADGQARTPKEIANITGMSWREVAGNFYNLSSDTENARCHRSWRNGGRKDSRFNALKKFYKVTRDRQQVERKYVAIDDNGQLDFDHPFTRKSYRTTYSVTRI